MPDKAVDLIDEAASALRLQLDSMPDELEVANKEIMKLEIEREVLKKKKKGIRPRKMFRKKKKKRLKEIDDSIRELKEKISEIQMKWKSEKENIDFISKLKKELEALKLEADASERKSDFAKVAELPTARYRSWKDSLSSKKTD